MGWEGEGEGGGEYKEKCLFNEDCNEEEYDNNNKYNEEEDGKGLCGGADDGGKSDNDGRDVVRGLSFGSVGHRISIVGPHAATAIIDNNDDNDRRHGGGASCPPPSSLSRPAGRRSSLLVSPTAVDGGGMGAFRVWSYAGWRRRRSAPVYLFVRL